MKHLIIIDELLIEFLETLVKFIWHFWGWKFIKCFIKTCLFSSMLNSFANYCKQEATKPRRVEGSSTEIFLNLLVLKKILASSHKLCRVHQSSDSFLKQELLTNIFTLNWLSPKNHKTKFKYLTTEKLK